MASTILFSAVGEAAGRFTPYVAEMRALLTQAGVPLGTSTAMTALAERLQEDSGFGEELTALVRVIYAEEPSITYLELLGIITLAARGDVPDGEAPAEAGLEAHGRRVLNFLVEVRRVMKAEMAGRWGRAAAELEPRAELELGPELGSSADLAPEPAVGSGPEPALGAESAVALPLAEVPMGVSKRAAATPAPSVLARALALAADGEGPGPLREAVGPEPERREEPRVKEEPRPGGERAEPVAVLLRESERPEGGGGRRMWLAVAGGVLLGLLLGVVLGYFLGRPGAPAGAPGPEQQAETSPAATAAAANSPTAARVPRVGRAGVPGAVAGERAPVEGFAVPSARRRVEPGAPAEASAAAGRVGAGAGSAERSGDAASRGAMGGSYAAGRNLAGAAAPAPPPVRAINLNPPAPGVADHGRGGVPRVTVGSAGIMAANVLAAPAPAYPAQASAAGVQGEVIVEAVVGRDGAVTDTRLVSGPAMLQEAALAAVQRWRYRPYEVDGQPAEIVTTARVQFRLN